MKYIIGAYATAPSLAISDKGLEKKFYEKLIDSIPQIRGLEIPFWGEEIHQFGSSFLLDIINPKWENVLTCIPGTMSYLAKEPSFGLASDNSKGRKNAIAMYKRVNDMLKKMNDQYGRKSIIAVQIVTAPSMGKSGVRSSVDSFMNSLDQIMSWDWDGARIVVEHCDRFSPHQPFEKGFLSIEDEIKGLLKISNQYNIGLTINWARSAIEGRSMNTPIQHLKLASSNKILSGLIFSGVSKSDELYGEWKDTHMPFAKSYNSTYYEEKSLLTKENIKQTLASINLEELDYLGVKLLSMPIEKNDVERRVGINLSAISILDQILL
tara:strand:- start:3495 stop:4463 length:969 start_codon:yes stop_codon:yes gene_type:complete